MQCLPFAVPQVGHFIFSVQMCEVYITSQHLCKWVIRATQRYKFGHQNGQITKLSS